MMKKAIKKLLAALLAVAMLCAWQYPRLRMKFLVLVLLQLLKLLHLQAIISMKFIRFLPAITATRTT